MILVKHSLGLPNAAHRSVPVTGATVADEYVMSSRGGNPTSKPLFLLIFSHRALCLTSKANFECDPHPLPRLD